MQDYKLSLAAFSEDQLRILVATLAVLSLSNSLRKIVAAPNYIFVFLIRVELILVVFVRERVIPKR